MMTTTYKGTILLDIDGVLLDFYTPFLNWYNARHGTSFVVQDLKKYDIAAGLQIDPQTIVQFHEDPICASLPLLDLNTVAFLRVIRSKGYRIVLNTDWPLCYVDKRVQNLADRHLIYDDIHYGKKTEVVQLYPDIVLIVEDNPKWISLYLSKGYALAVPQRFYLREETIVQDRRILMYDSLFEIFRYFFLGEK